MGGKHVSEDEIAKVKKLASRKTDVTVAQVVEGLNVSDGRARLILDAAQIKSRKEGRTLVYTA